VSAVYRVAIVDFPPTLFYLLKEAAKKCHRRRSGPDDRQQLSQSGSHKSAFLQEIKATNRRQRTSHSMHPI
jgi:hypothetical protein